MASPQVEDGYTKIANELLDALIKVPVGNADAQVVYAILRKTYGWSKKEDTISIGQLQEMTGLARRTVIYALKNLEAKNMIVIKRVNVDGFNAVNKISFQKNYTKWVVQGKAENYKKTLEKQKLNYHVKVVQENGGSARNGNGVVQETVKGSARNEQDGVFLAPTKETIQKKVTKEITTKEIYGSFVELTKPEYEKLIKKFGEQKTTDIIEFFNLKIESKGLKEWRKDHKSDYATILMWDRSGWIKLNTPGENPLLSKSSEGIMGWAARERARMAQKAQEGQNDD